MRSGQGIPITKTEDRGIFRSDPSAKVISKKYPDFYLKSDRQEPSKKVGNDTFNLIDSAYRTQTIDGKLIPEIMEIFERLEIIKVIALSLSSSRTSRTVR